MQTNFVLLALTEMAVMALAAQVENHPQVEMIGHTHGQAAERILFRADAMNSQAVMLKLIQQGASRKEVHEKIRKEQGQ
jgi:adenylosuccinate lyase